MLTFKVNGKVYKQVDKISTTVPDCFVKINKLVTEKNKIKDKPSSGESRIYVGPQRTLNSSNFFSFPNTIKYLKNTFNSSVNNVCFFSKDNLKEYMGMAEREYTHPSINFFYDITGDYEIYLKRIEQLNNLEFFTIFNHKGKTDSSRFYINSMDDKIWDLLREISLPDISFLNIYKLCNENGEVLYYFELTLNERHAFKNKIKRENNIVEQIKNDTNISETQKLTLINARKGQGKFRNNVISIMKKCPFTGISDRTLLRASHIKPWVECQNNHERLDGYNGISLTPTYDVLFDRGLISFDNDGTLIISSILSDEIISRLNLKSGMKYDINNDNGKRNTYLEYHRKNVFKK